MVFKTQNRLLDLSDGQTQSIIVEDHITTRYHYCLKTTSRVAHFSVVLTESSQAAGLKLRQQETLTWTEFRVAMASPLSVSTKMIVIISCSGN